MAYSGEHVSIDSHSSMLNNKRLIGLLMLVDQTAIVASNSLCFGAVKEYYNATEQAYINACQVCDPSLLKDDIEPVRKKYCMLLNLIESNPAYRTKKALELLLSYVKDFNYHLITGLQDMNYFFRTSSKMPKGLKHIGFLAGNGIFTTRREKTEGNENEF